MNSLENKLRNRSRNRPGRSVEEVVLLRKFGGGDSGSRELDGNDPETWPNLKESQLYPHHRVFDLSDVKSRLSSRLEKDRSSGLLSSAVSFSGIEASHLDANPLSSEHLISNQLRDYCKYLELKVQELEHQLQMANDVGRRVRDQQQSEQSTTFQETSNYREQSKIILIPKSKHGDKKLSTVASLIKEGYSAGRNLDKDLMLREDLKNSLGEIDIKMFGLRELFRRGNPFEIRYTSATKLVAIVRGFLSRRRYQGYLQGIKSWKWARLKTVVYVLDHWLAQQTKVDVGIKRLQLLRNMRLMLAIFRKWSFVSRKRAPLHKRSRAEADKMFEDKKKEFLRRAFQHFRDGCIGQQSQRETREQRRRLVEKVREDLREKRLKQGEDPSIMLEDEVQRMIYKEIVKSSLERRQRSLTSRVFNGFRTNVKISKRNDILAKKHWFKNRVGKCFYGWSDYIYLVGQELQRKRWPGPRQYIVRYNQKRLDYFARKRLLRYAFYPLKTYIVKQIRAKQAYQRHITKILKSMMVAWRTVAAKDHGMKKSALLEWLDYPKTMTRAPFAAWKRYILAAKLRQSENNSIAKGYIRWKSRQKLYVIMRTWRHQALYGRIDGLYSRQMLVKSLQEQKEHCHSLTKLLATQSMELEECRSLVQVETAKKDETLEKLRACYMECSRYVPRPFDFVSHHN